MSEQCPKCKKYIWPWVKHHRCPPLWYARFDDWDEDDIRRVYASEASDAAEQFLADWDADETSTGSSTREVFIRPIGEPGKWTKFEVYMSWEPTYDAVEAPDAAT